MNTLSILMIALVVIGLNLAFVVLAIQLGTRSIKELLQELVALQMTIRQQQVHQQVETNLHRQVHSNLQKAVQPPRPPID